MANETIVVIDDDESLMMGSLWLSMKEGCSFEEGVSVVADGEWWIIDDGVVVFVDEGWWWIEDGVGVRVDESVSVIVVGGGCDQDVQTWEYNFRKVGVNH